MNYRVLLVPASLCLLVACGSARGTPGATSPDRNTVTAKDLEGSTENFAVLLMRKVPGLQASFNGANELVLMIRGTSSHLAEDTPPLYIMDGLPFTPGQGGAITGIEPEMIESVKVLKGPDAAIYGIEGARGVIVITTKRGGRRK